MPEKRWKIPSPRADVARPDLTRPDWVKGLERDASALWLDKNENLDPALHEAAKRVLREINPLALNTYPESAAFYRKLGSQLGVAPEHLVLTPGSDGAIRAVFEAFISPGDRVLHTNPTFAMYSVYSKMYGAATTALDYLASANGPELGLARLLDTIRSVKPKLVCLPNPDSPTGSVFKPNEMRQIIEAAGETQSLILIDEAYHPFYEPTVLSWVIEYDHLVVARTFAKAWGLAGLRIGYAAASLQVAQLLHKVRPMYEVNTFAVEFMNSMLEHAHEMQASVDRLNAGKAYFQSEMKRLGFRVLDCEGNFLHVSFGAKAPAIFATLEGNVLFRKDFAEPCLKGFSRFSATTKELFEPVVAKIKGAALNA